MAETTRVFSENDVRELLRPLLRKLEDYRPLGSGEQPLSDDDLERALVQVVKNMPSELTEEVIARSRVDLLIALVLTEEGLWDMAWGELIPQAVWDKAHEELLVRGGRDFTGEGTMFLTPKGRELLADALREGRS